MVSDRMKVVAAVLACVSAIFLYLHISHVTVTEPVVWALIDAFSLGAFFVFLIA